MSVLHLLITFKYQFSRQTILSDCTLQVLSKQFEWQYKIFLNFLFDNITVKFTNSKKGGLYGTLAYCTDRQIIGHNMVFLKNCVRKDWKQFLAKITTIFIGTDPL